jgi:hypothetical protein
VRYRSACGESTPTNLLVWGYQLKNKIQPTSNEQRNYTSSGTSSRRKIFIQPLNAQGEVMSIPTGHTVPYGYRKHCKLVEKHFKAGVVSRTTA